MCVGVYEISRSINRGSSLNLQNVSFFSMKKGRVLGSQGVYGWTLNGTLLCSLFTRCVWANNEGNAFVYIISGSMNEGSILSGQDLSFFDTTKCCGWRLKGTLLCMKLVGRGTTLDSLQPWNDSLRECGTVKYTENQTKVIPRDQYVDAFLFSSTAVEDSVLMC